MEALRIAEGESGFCASDAMGSMDQLCGRVLQIIDKEYMDEALTLQSVSDRLHVSASYLGPNIKKECGRYVHQSSDSQADGSGAEFT